MSRHSGHVRSAQRAPPVTPNAHPLGISGLPLAAPTSLSAGVSAHVHSGFPIMPGFPSQPQSSRWPVSDDRFDSSPHSPRFTKAVPKPNFCSLDSDRSAWMGGQLSVLRGGKSFTFAPHERPSLFSPRTQLGPPDPVQLGSDRSGATNIGEPLRRPLSPCNDRLVPERPVSWGGVPRAVFAPATTLRELRPYVPPKKAISSEIHRMHAGRSRVSRGGS